jgi:hypothetical protein
LKERERPWRILRMAEEADPGIEEGSPESMEESAAKFEGEAGRWEEEILK